MFTNLRIKNNNLNSFTLIELLVVLALVAILSVVVVMTLNPAELIKQARDSNRLSDLSTINTALNLFSADVTSGFMGTSTVVYVSIPDNASSTCGSLGLPTLPSGYTYKCATTATLRNTDGTGWIPVNFQRISSNSPISQLPIDPINTTSSGSYYSYVTGGSWILTAMPESQKQKVELSASPHIQNYPGVIGLGNDLNLSPIYNPSGLVGYWKFDENSGAVARDYSGNGNNGTANGSTAWSAGKVGDGSVSVNGFSSAYLSAPNSSVYEFGASQDFTLSLWVKTTQAQAGSLWPLVINNDDGNGPRQGYHICLFNQTIQNSWFFNIYSGGGDVGVVFSGRAINDGAWHMITAGRQGSTIFTYTDGLFNATSTGSVATLVGKGPLGIGANSALLSWGHFTGSVDDTRIYSRALSAAEILALYNATK